MNKDVFEGKWKQIRGQAKGWWGRLTDDDLNKVAGKFESFVGLLQEKYGYSRERAHDAYHDIEDQALLRIRMHDPTGYITDDRSSNKIDNEVHFFFSF